MPTYEYRCATCGEKREAMRPMSESSEPLVAVCIDRPLSSLEQEAGITDADRKQCTFNRILSPTPTDFRFNDFSGYDGLDKRRPGM